MIRNYLLYPPPPLMPTSKKRLHYCLHFVSYFIRRQTQATVLRNELAAVRQELVSREQQEEPTSPIVGHDAELKSKPPLAVAETVREEEAPLTRTSLLPSMTTDDDSSTWRGRYEHLAGLFASQTKELNEKVGRKSIATSPNKSSFFR